MPFMTPEDLEAWLEAGDLSEEERKLARQYNFAGQLREASLAIPVRRGSGKDLGGNIARAAYGIGGALGEYKAGEASGELGQRKVQRLLELARRRRGAVPRYGAPEPIPTYEEDEWGRT